MTRLVTRQTASVRISPQLIQRYELLRLPSHELAAHLRDMSYANPLLEVVEHPFCPRCGSPLASAAAFCRQCRSQPGEDQGWVGHRSSSDDAESQNWMEALSAGRTLSETLWLQCLELGMTEDEREIACHLITDLDEHGYLSSSLADLTLELSIPPSEVEQVRQKLMRLEPLGIGATGPRECLLVQLQAVSEDARWATVAQRLVAEQWDALLRGDLRAAARALRIPRNDVTRAVRIMMKRLYLYPAFGFQGRDTETIYLQPDVRFVQVGQGAAALFEIEVVEARRYSIGITPDYRGLVRRGGGQDSGASHQIAEWATEVRRVAAALRQRWSTLRQVCECIVDFQRDFFMDPSRFSALRPLRRDEIANTLGVHPSTVGRAVNGKYAELPDRRIVPLSLLFDSSVPVQALISELVTDETAFLSDETLRHHLQRAGWSMTRRAVALHRESMGILPTHLRRLQRNFLVNV